MVQTIQAKDITLLELETLWGLQLIRDRQFFREWQDDLPEITELEKQQLDKVQAGYFNLLRYPPMLENVVKMSVLDPLLFIGDFYLSPFYVKSEKSIEISVADEDIIIKGSLDALVLKEQFWVMVIESKQVAFSIEAGIAQILTYMLANPYPEKPSFGMITTGGSFTFLKLVKGDTIQYATSKVFELRNPDNELYDVLRILKRLSHLVISSTN
ncbi:restriction endonuclease subunit R [Scytonema sp. NUACC26]|uniref:restriction endonuclease subunit R n=1 Tax=Scytonema sp. NUACC26 TaxID=3140176 RepID=UPI0034DB9B47